MFGGLVGLGCVVRCLRGMLTAVLVCRCHYKSRSTRVNRGSRLDVPYMGELRQSELSGSVGKRQAVVWCCPMGGRCACLVLPQQAAVTSGEQPGGCPSGPGSTCERRRSSTLVAPCSARF